MYSFADDVDVPAIFKDTQVIIFYKCIYARKALRFYFNTFHVGKSFPDNFLSMNVSFLQTFLKRVYHFVKKITWTWVQNVKRVKKWKKTLNTTLETENGNK